MGISLFHPYVLFGIVLSVLLAYGGGRAQQWHRDEVNHAKQTAKWKAEAEAAKVKRESEWVKAVDEGESRLKGKISERDGQLVQANQRAADFDAAAASCRVAGVGILLNQSIRESVGVAPSAAQPQGDSGATTTVADWRKWSDICINKFAKARDQIIELNAYYENLRGAK